MSSSTTRAASVDGWRLASLNHTDPTDRHIFWWGPEDASYWNSLEDAGCYELATLAGHPGYYGTSNVLCVPDLVARRLARGGSHVRNVAKLRLVSLFTHGQQYPLPIKTATKDGRGVRAAKVAQQAAKRRALEWEAQRALRDAFHHARSVVAFAYGVDNYELAGRISAAMAVLEELPGLAQQTADVAASRLRECVYIWARSYGLTPTTEVARG